MGGHGRTRARGLTVMAVAAITAASLTACGGSGGSGPSGFSALLTTENTTTPAVLEALSKNECKAENDALPLTIETVPQTQIDQKVQLLAGQGALPVLYGAGTPAIIKALAANGQVVDLEKSLTDSGAISNVLPGAIATIKNLYGGFYVLPLQYNIEGIWYNKRIFADHGIEVPATWDQLVSAAQKLSAAGVQPFSASGQQKWPLTRFISGYIYRKLGPNAFDAVYDGSAKFTDPDYVAAAAAVADLGSNDWFGKGVGSIDYDTATNTFLTRKRR